MYKIAILYICTGKYEVFWKDFFKSSEKYLFNMSEKQYYVFTDAKNIYKEDNVHKIYQKNLGWPKNTLMRFEMFDSIKDELKQYDYIVFFNANLEFKDYVGEEILPIKENLIVVQHPGFYNKKRNQFTYETNPKSLAYIGEYEGEIYVAGGLNGGKSEAYLELIERLKINIEQDLTNNIVAKWHDESHLNRYIIGRKDVKVLSPEYLYPEGWKLSFTPKILVKDKEKWGGHNKLRGIKETMILDKIKNIINQILE